MSGQKRDLPPVDETLLAEALEIATAAAKELNPTVAAMLREAALTTYWRAFAARREAMCLSKRVHQ